MHQRYTDRRERNQREMPNRYYDRPKYRSAAEDFAYHSSDSRLR